MALHASNFTGSCTPSCATSDSEGSALNIIIECIQFSKDSAIYELVQNLLRDDPENDVGEDVLGALCKA